MSRFERAGRSAASRARDAVERGRDHRRCCCVLFSGGSVRDAAAEIDPGVGRDVVAAVGEPTELGRRQAAVRRPRRRELTSGPLARRRARRRRIRRDRGRAPPAGARGCRRSPPDAFDPAEIGAQAAARSRSSRPLLVTGDSLSTPLDSELARRLAAGRGRGGPRSPPRRPGSRTPTIVDWGELSTAQVASDHPDAVVVFIGANEGYAMPGPGRRARSSAAGPTTRRRSRTGSAR